MKSSLFGFQKETTLVLYVLKLNKTVLILTSTHLEDDSIEGDDKNTLLLHFTILQNAAQ